MTQKKTSRLILKFLRRNKMDKIDLVVGICKNVDSLNGFYKVCEKYGLSSEQMQQALALLNNRTKVPEGGNRDEE